MRPVYVTSSARPLEGTVDLSRPRVRERDAFTSNHSRCQRYRCIDPGKVGLGGHLAMVPLKVEPRTLSLGITLVNTGERFTNNSSARGYKSTAPLEVSAKAGYGHFRHDCQQGLTVKLPESRRG